MIYLTSRARCCGVVNRDVVKLEVDLHCEKQPPCFPFPVKPKQMREVWGVHSGSKHTTKVWVSEQVPAEAIEEVVSYRTSACKRLSSQFPVFLSAFPSALPHLKK